VRAPGTATVYLIDKGFRRGVPHIPAYEALFRDWECIVEDIDVETIRPGDPLGDNTGLIRLNGQPAVYFVDGTTRRHVANPQVMDIPYAAISETFSNRWKLRVISVFSGSA
jgi:hypothetical protein